MVGVAVDVIDIDRQAVGYDHFLKEAPEHQPQAVEHPVVIETRPGSKLWQESGGSLYRARDKLREEGHVEREYSEVPLGFLFPLIDIYRIAEGLERIERDSYRQYDVQCRHTVRHAEMGEDMMSRLIEEIEILE